MKLSKNNNTSFPFSSVKRNMTCLKIGLKADTGATEIDGTMPSLEIKMFNKLIFVKRQKTLAIHPKNSKLRGNKIAFK